jgi:hypothetical protein
MGFGFPTGMRLVSAISSGPTPWFWGINGAAGVLAASVAVVTSIAFSIDMTLRIGAACYLLIAAPAVLLAFAGTRPSQAVLRSLHPSKAANMWKYRSAPGAACPSSYKKLRPSHRKGQKTIPAAGGSRSAWLLAFFGANCASRFFCSLSG